jgi:ribose 5-phosphate isomerase B
MKLAIGSDHAGFALKEVVRQHLISTGHEVVDYGTYDSTSVDYPDYASKVCESILDEEAMLGVLICFTGIGMSIAANKFKGIRAGCVGDVEGAFLTRAHNNANVLCMGSRKTGDQLACDIVDTFVRTEFEGGRHERRVQKMSDLEKEE